MKLRASGSSASGIHGPFVPALSGLDLLLSNPLSALAILRHGDTWAPLGP